VGFSWGVVRRPSGAVPLDQVINPFLLYAAIALGGIGVCLALPRKLVSPQPLGALIAAIAGAIVLVGLGLNAEGQLPSVYFYIFAAIALGSALRVISHPRPVYAALYFILTILASAGLYLLLSAEFMAFALVIVYAGAILITYLFVIMLATQAPSEEDVDALAEYDRQSREPLMATAAGFVLLAVLTTMFFRGSADLTPEGADRSPDAVLADLPRRVEGELRAAQLIEPDEQLVTDGVGGPIEIDLANRTVVVEDEFGRTRTVAMPDELRATNVEGVGFNLLNDHPGAIEIAGVILLMAMLGAVVLSRKQVEIEEEAKAHEARRLSEEGVL